MDVLCQLTCCTCVSPARWARYSEGVFYRDLGPSPCVAGARSGTQGVGDGRKLESMGPKGTAPAGLGPFHCCRVGMQAQCRWTT